MRQLSRRLIGTAVALAALGVVVYASTKEPAKVAGAAPGSKRAGATGAAGEQPSPVLAGEAKIADVPVQLEGVGTVKALNTVTVKALVEGKIVKFNFKEGDFVKKNDVLAEIDPAPYQAALDQVLAKKLVDETLLGNAQKDLERYGKVSVGVIAQKTVDTQEALVRQLSAQVKADAAAVASAQTVMDYTKVIAPIDGRTGIRLIDAGNVVRTGDTAGIVVLTQLQPLNVVFTLPQQQLPQIAKAMAAGPVVAEAMDGDNKLALDRGTLQVVDNQVDQTTGTIKLKAEFPNEKLQLWPGQFVNLRVLVDTLMQVVVVPTPAVQRGPLGAFVFTVTPDSKVAQRPVTLGLQNDTQSVVLTGVTAGDRVVTTGFARLQDGARVIIAERTGGESPKSAPPSPAGPAPAAGADTPPVTGSVVAPAPNNGAATNDRPKGSGKRRDAKGAEPPAKSVQQ